MLNNKAFCIKPWTHACIRTNGDMTLCCRSSELPAHNLKISSIGEWWAGEFITTIRKQMLDGKSPDACQYCTDQEAKNLISDRQQANKENKIFKQYLEKILDYYQYPKLSPIDIEFQLTNLCNLKCIMCAGHESSSLASENKILKISTVDNKDYIVTKDEVEKIKEWVKTKPRLINLRGGEPMMVPEIKEILKWALDNNLLDSTEVHITTNGTKLDSEWLELLQSISKLRVMFSIDAVGQLNEYIRYGSNWEQIVENVKKISMIPEINLIVHPTLQNLNILYFDQLIVWCKENNYYLDLEFLSEPKMFDCRNLPLPLLELAKEKLSLLNDDVANKIVNVISQSIQDQTMWGTFTVEINLRDLHRKNSVFDVLPEFKEYWHA